jgi:hypothetical protein
MESDPIRDDSDPVARFWSAIRLTQRSGIVRDDVILGDLGDRGRA